MAKYYLFLICTFIFISAFAQAPDIAKDNTIEYARIPLPDGDSLSAVIVISKTANNPLPAILMYSIYASEKNDLARAAIAANMGYAGVVVNTRGMNKSKSSVEPFKHDAEDAWHMLDWISKQKWCDGQIGMYGGSYVGFSQWAAAKSGHPALKTIVPQAAVGVGIDFPAHNGIFSVYSLKWLNNIMDAKMYEAKNFGGKSLHKAIDRWAGKGLAFRVIDSLAEGPNNVYREWLGNPSYNGYWQKMVPYKEEFAAINIPVLTTTGYYDADQLGALYYYKEHLKYNPSAEHYLIMGPYDHFGAQGMQGEKVLNYPLPEKARLNFYKVIFQWFDYVLKGKDKPDVLKDKVNYQVMGTEEWRSAPSLEQMGTATLKFYLSNEKAGIAYRLATSPPAATGGTTQKIDFKNNSEYGRSIYNNEIVTRKLRPGGIQFVSEPLAEGLIINGNMRGELHAIVNKKDMDIVMELFELTSGGDFISLSHFLGRASYTKDRATRHLLIPGATETIPFENSYLISKKINAGSRLVVVLGINKNQNSQVNYGTGKDVSDETREDAKEPLEVQWLNSSIISIPVLP
ncbi:peptidase S15 [Flavobacterium album]|uniref:Peptidase S15 n=1 Tax=Flavobacterium album TaxID=2175091 RepID=A0A2S1QXY1_9FLAO|nr:CocE/NonD family hydrolase [Flavobacterium album]AWH85245.1 peptidase S15 [Flavobacterium album]